MKPCNNCPFRKDVLEGWLGVNRAREVSLSAIGDVTFHCHKTLTNSGKIGIKSKVCAGSVLLHKKEGHRNRYYRLIEENYSGDGLVFDSVQDFIKHHRR